jgi:hypothetical protein
VGRQERMKSEVGMKDREERSKGIQIRIADAFAIIKPTTPFKLAKHETRRKRNLSDSSGNSCPVLFFVFPFFYPVSAECFLCGVVQVTELCLFVHHLFPYLYFTLQETIHTIWVVLVTDFLYCTFFC